MSRKLIPPLLQWLFLLSLLFLFLYSAIVSLQTPISPFPQPTRNPIAPTCDFFTGHWNRNTTRRPIYDETCPFHRNAWNCLRNNRDNMGIINSWKWVPGNCDLPQIDPFRFLDLMRNKNIGFVGDSLNENFIVAFLCSLRVGDLGAKKWKRKGAWRGAYFPKFNVTVAYHRSVLLAKYMWQPKNSASSDQSQSKGTYRVDVDIPADDWANISNFYDVLVFNTGHWWGYDKFPKEKPLVFYRGGQPIVPPLELLDGLKLVLEQMVSYIQKEIPGKKLKFWRLQSPRHFYGGEWNQNGSCLFNEPLRESQLDDWFNPSNNGVNKEARTVNQIIKETLKGTDIQVIDVTHLSEFRADAHPAIWLGRRDAVAVWGQDCLHWCLPGVPDTWVDILSELITHALNSG